MKYRHIVAGTDLSETARVATDRAAMLASKLGAKLTLLYAGTNPGYPLGALGRLYGANYLSVAGSPGEVLVDASARLEADLLVVGSLGMTGARRFMLRSVPNKVSHSTTMDLLIVKSDFAGARARANEYRSIVIGTDGSETSMLAVDVGCAIAAALDAKPVIVSAYEPSPSNAEAEGNDDSDSEGNGTWQVGGRMEAAEVLERAAARAESAGAPADVRAVEGGPAEVILSLTEAEDFDLIVVGNVGMSGARRFMLGNVPHRISHRAPADVLILKTK
jgi:nucleotide-binding universal stress UspA family protein